MNFRQKYHVPHASPNSGITLEEWQEERKKMSEFGVNDQLGFSLPLPLPLDGGEPRFKTGT